MGNDKVFKRRREQRRRREIETRTPRCETFLITSEGEKTEPNYLKGLVGKLTGAELSRVTDDVEEIDIRGLGRVTSSLVEETAKIVNRSSKNYDNVWVVFDRDTFEDFDAAVALAESMGFHAAWSNESFEYWLCLYFGRYDTALTRDDWCDKLDSNLVERGQESYRKNREDIFASLDEVGDHEKAIRFARSIREAYGDNVPPSRCNPCTTVDLLVCRLEEALGTFGKAERA